MSTKKTTVPNLKTKASQNLPTTTINSKMDNLFQTILKTAIEAIPLLMIDNNYTLWKN
jgi:hypothetical protein